MIQRVDDRSQTFFGRLVLTVFWGVGYFFGFSLISILSFGLCHAEEFSVLTHGRANGHRFAIFKRFGNYYLEAQYVAFVGWIFAGAMIFLATL